MFAKLTIQIHNLAAQKEVTLVQSEPVAAYIPTGRGRGRPKKSEVIARSYTKINEFFALVPPGTRAR